MAKPAYWAGLRLDQARKARRAQPLGRPTVSVGNLTAGGTGKTPFTVDLVRRLQTLGHRPAVLLRGYHAPPNPGSRSASDPGETSRSDEAQLLQRTLGPGVPVRAHPSRLAAAAALLEQDPSISCFVLDDGFQHRQVQRDLDLVLLDATRPFGFGHLLPRGLLREPRSALARADAVILTRVDQIKPAELDVLICQVQNHHGRPPIAHTAHTWTELRDEHGDVQPTPSLAETALLGVCAIGNPDAFANQLAQHAGRPVDLLAYPDHHAYTCADLQHITGRASAMGVEAVVTTDKDWVKLAPLLTEATASFTVKREATQPRWLRPQLAWTWTRGEAEFTEWLERRLPASTP